MKVVISVGYGNPTFPKCIKDRISEAEFPLNRCGSLVHLLESYPIETDDAEAKKKLEALKPEQVVRYKNRFFVGTRPYISQWEIVEVDDSRPWTITEYDGTETISYIEQYPEKHNYCRLLPISKT